MREEIKNTLASYRKDAPCSRTWVLHHFSRKSMGNGTGGFACVEKANNFIVEGHIELRLRFFQ